MTKMKQMCRTLTVKVGERKKKEWRARNMWALFKKEIKNGGHATCGPSSRMKWGVNLTDDRCTKTQKMGENDINELQRG
jgi:hypothetical protein